MNVSATRKTNGIGNRTTRSTPSRSRRQSAAGRPRTRAKPRIAIVDDHPDIAEALAFLVTGWTGYEADAFTSGADFLASLEKRRPDAVILDLWMPPPDGREIMRELQRRGLGDIPVVIISAAGEAAIKEAIAAGAVAAIQKPAQRSELVSVLRRVLAKKR